MEGIASAFVNTDMNQVTALNMPTRGRWRRGFRRLGIFAASALTVAVARADDWAPNFTFSGTWNSNASNADRSSDQIDSLQFNADALAAKRYGFGRDDAVIFTGRMAGEWWPRYDQLLSGSVGGRAEWQHKFGVDALAPIFSVEGAADAVGTRETGRRGATLAATASLRKRFNDRTRVTLAHEVSWHNARFSVYDRYANETSLTLDHDVTPLTRFTLGARYRRGDVVSYATDARPDLVAISSHQLAVTTFDRDMTAYSVDARTWSARAALTRALDDNSAIILSYEWRDSRRSPLSFTNHLVSIALVHQF
jgi:hypothetical protein